MRAQPSVVLLPDEPYVFTATDGPEALPGLRCVLLEGRSLTWYGPSLLTARATIEAALKSERASEAAQLTEKDTPQPK